jgi:predicted RNase H-like HicB family nuclease
MKGETVEVALKKADCAFDGVINGEETQDFQEQEAQDFQEQNAQA